MRALTSLVGFSVGAYTAGRLADRWHVQPGQLLRRVSLVVTGALLSAGHSWPSWITRPEMRRCGSPSWCSSAWAMGLVNATARTLGIRDIPTTVATSTISDLAASAGRDMPRRSQLVRAAAIGAMLIGAACGAALLRLESMTAAFALACAAALAATALQLRARRAADQTLRTH